MKKLTVSYKKYDIVVVPFPFTDQQSTKRRPALVLSDSYHFNAQIAHSVLAMVTSSGNSPWPLDIEISDLDAAGLTSPSIIRMKLFTLDHQLILRHIGSLAEVDRLNISLTLATLFGSQKS